MHITYCIEVSRVLSQGNKVAASSDLGVGTKSHGRAAPAVPSAMCCTSNLIFIDYVSFKLYISHMIYFTVVSRTKIVFCSKLCFY